MPCFERFAALLMDHLVRWFASIAMLALAACAANEEPQTSQTAAGVRVRWVDTCLAIKNDAIEPGTPVTVVMFDDDEHATNPRALTRRVGGKILEKTTSAAKCPALIEDVEEIQI